MSPLDPANVFDTAAPLVGMPAWWRTFIFQILNSRQLCVYFYLIMCMDSAPVCSPTTEEIAADLGLLSSTMVYEAINVLEHYGLILRSRRSMQNARTRRNVYQRPAIEYTLLRLLHQYEIDEHLRIKRSGLSPEAGPLFERGLKAVLGPRYERYAKASAGEKRAVLIQLLEDALAEKTSVKAQAG